MLLPPSGATKGQDNPLSGLFDRNIGKKTEKPKKPVRELNPYFASGGSGLPPDGQSLAGKNSSHLIKPSGRFSLDREAIRKDVIRERFGQPLGSRQACRRKAKYDGDDELLPAEHEFVKQDYINAHLQRERACSKCSWCIESEVFDKDLLIASGNYVYLSLPQGGDYYIGGFHCTIVPIQHAPSSLLVNEDELEMVWEEMRNFKKCLWKLATSLDKDVLFMENVRDPHNRAAHTAIHAVFVPANGPDPRVFFRKAFLEADEEWSSNAGIIDTKDKGLRSSIPHGFAFCYVDFRLDQGYVHLIENRRLIREEFLISIAFDLVADGRRNHNPRRRPTVEDVARFRRAYLCHDWTALLLAKTQIE